MLTRSPPRVDRLCFFLRLESTVRTAENLGRRSSLSLKSQKPHFLTFPSPLSLLVFKMEKITLLHFVFILINLFIIPILSFFLIFDTLHNLGHSSHPLSTHATCVTLVHVVGDFCHNTCLSEAVLLHPCTRCIEKREIPTVSELKEIRPVS